METQKHEIKQYVDGDRVIVYETGLLGTDKEPVEIIRILKKPLSKDYFEITWNQIKNADNLGEEKFENMSSHANYIQIDRDPDFGVIKRVRISDKDKEFNVTYIRDYSEHDSILGFNNLKTVESKIEKIVNEVFKNMGKLIPTKIVKKPDYQTLNLDYLSI